MGGSIRGKVPWCGHVHPMVGPPGLRALGQLLRGGTLGAGYWGDY